MFPVLRRSLLSRCRRLPTPTALSLLVAVSIVAALMGAGLTQPVAAEPISYPVGNSTPTSFASTCDQVGGQLIEITNDSGGILSSSCEHSGGFIWECDWVGGTCTVRIRPTSNPLQDNRPSGEIGGVLVDETVTPVLEPTGDGQAVLASQVAADQVGACEALGGTATLIEQSTRPVDVRCTGGTLDGMICYGTICDYFASATGPEEDGQVHPTGGIVFVQLEDLAEATGGVTPGEAEDPTGIDTVVIANQSGSPVGNAMLQVAMCRLAGGVSHTETEYEHQTAGSVVTSVGVMCAGGLLGGMGCYNTATTSACLLRAVVPQDRQVTPAAGVEVPAEDVPNDMDAGTDEELTPTVMPTEPTAASTEAPMESTVEPTEAPAEPTVPPTTAPPPPKNDAGVPPGEVGDSSGTEPTPTAVVLQ